MSVQKQKFHWNLRSNKDRTMTVPSFFREKKISPALARIFMRRGVDTEEKLDHFLYDDLSSLSDPFLMKGMKEAVSRILEAIDQGQKIVIYGDYDVDGMTSTSVMLRCLKSMGAQVDFYIPIREKEGYGLNEKAVGHLADKGYQLLITVDCGISSAELIARAPASMDIIVTDHHIPPDRIPRCEAVLNPHQRGCPYPFKELCGCGVAFMLCRGLYMEKYGRYYDEDVELAALGTVADVVSLTGENRVIVREGMKRMAHTQNVGLAALLKESGLVSDRFPEINEAGRISFTLAPRLNAAGRIATASEGVRLLTTDSPDEAEKLAKKLCEINNRRKTIEADILEASKKRIAELKIEKDLVLVIDGKEWHPGVIGIVASRILEMYHRPVLMLSVRDGVGKGSCRSIPGFNIVDALKSQSSLLMQYGGHEMAAGFSIKEENIPLFREKINDYASHVMTKDMLIPALQVEDSIPLKDMTLDFVHSLHLLEPCGCDNPKPVFEIPDLFVETSRRMGLDQKHFKCQVSDGSCAVDAILWNCGDEDPCKAGDTVDIIAEPEIHEWNGEQVQLLLKDLRGCTEHVLTRDILAEIYKGLRRMTQNGAVPSSHVYDGLSRKLYVKPYIIQLSLAVFYELSLISRYKNSGVEYIQLKNVHQKMDLLSSSIYRTYKK